MIGCFIAGMFIGCGIGMIVMCLLVAGSDGEGGGRDEH